MKAERYKIILSDEDEKIVERYMKEKWMIHKAQACRELLVMGSTNDFDQEQIDILTSIVRNELNVAMDGHNKRIKSILFKAGIFVSTSTYFLVGLLRDVIPDVNKKNLETLYENASKFAVKEVKRKED